MKTLSLTRIVVGETYGEAPSDTRGKNAKLDHPQTHKYVDTVIVGDVRELIEAAKHLVGSLDEQGAKPAGISRLREELAKFNLDGPRY